MGKDLYYLVMKFFMERMDAHDKVTTCSEIPDDNEILYLIKRTGDLPPLIVHISDCIYILFTIITQSQRYWAKEILF